MTTLTIQAADTASAMEEIADRLGEDALILSTTKKDGKVIAYARNKRRGPACTSKPLLRLSQAEEFNQMYNAGLSGSLPGKPRLSPKTKARPAAAASAQPELSDTVQQGDDAGHGADG